MPPLLHEVYSKETHCSPIQEKRTRLIARRHAKLRSVRHVSSAIILRISVYYELLAVPWPTYWLVSHASSLNRTPCIAVFKTSIGGIHVLIIIHHSDSNRNRSQNAPQSTELHSRVDFVCNFQAQRSLGSVHTSLRWHSSLNPIMSTMTQLRTGRNQTRV